MAAAASFWTPSGASASQGVYHYAPNMTRSGRLPAGKMMRRQEVATDATSLRPPAPAGVGGERDLSPRHRPVVLIAGMILAALFVAILFAARREKIFEFPLQTASVSGEDFLAFWRAGVMALDGEAASVYDPAIFIAPLPSSGAGLRFLNPPHFLLVAAPFGLMPYGVAKFLFLVLTASALAALANFIRASAPAFQRRPETAAALLAFSPAMFASLLIMQIGPLVAPLLAGGLLLARRRPVLAGFLLALATMKPQFGLMAPIYLAARGEWRAIIAAIGWTLALCLASTAAFGVEIWPAFAKSLSTVHAAHASILHRDMVSVAQAAGKLGLSDHLRFAAQVAIIAPVAMLVWAAARLARPEGRDIGRDGEAVGLTLLASAIASPSLWVYDWPMVAAGVLMIAGGGRRLSPPIQVIAILVWIAPLVPLGLLTHASSLATTGFLALGVAAFGYEILRANLKTGRAPA